MSLLVIDKAESLKKMDAERKALAWDLWKWRYTNAGMGEQSLCLEENPIDIYQRLDSSENIFKWIDSLTIYLEWLGESDEEVADEGNILLERLFELKRAINTIARQ